MEDQNSKFKGGFETLEAWKEARIFRNKIKELVSLFPDEEKYMLKNQIIRSSRSIGNNIAEGYGRFHYQETIQFCRAGRGSLTETMDHLFVALDSNYIDQNKFDNIKGDCDRLLKLINGYVAYLIRKKKDNT